MLGKGPLDLVLVNPMSRSIEMLWDYPANAALLQRLAGFSRLVVFDRRGSGISDPLPLDAKIDTEAWCEDLAAVLNTVGSKNAVIFAECEAGRIGLEYAARDPQRVSKLILSNTSPRLALPRKWVRATISWPG